MDHVKQVLRRLLVAYPANVIALSIVSGALFIITDGIISPRVKDATSLTFKALGGIEVLCFLIFFVIFAWGIVRLVMRSWLSVPYHLLATCIAIGSLYASAFVKGDRFTFTAGAHDEIASIYNRNLAEFSRQNTGPRLISLDEQCHPPNGCECWIVVDPDHTSGVENEVHGWHRPAASIFSMETFSRHFEIVDVRQINPGASQTEFRLTVRIRTPG
jgi:hypothetical protein